MRSEIITWAGGEHAFALTVPLLIALQDRCCGDGVGLIYQRIENGSFKVQDILATLHLGLEGGGMDKREAVKLVYALYEDHGVNALVIPAQVVLALSLNGWPEQETEEGEGGVETLTTS